MSNRSYPWAAIAVTILIVILLVLPFLLNGACQSPHSTEPKPVPQESPPPRPIPPDDFSARVVGVIDGDTIDVLVENSGEEQASGSKFTVRVRLADIDCPEKGQPFGRRAKQATSDLCFGQVVRVAGERRDRNGRLLGEVILPDGKSLNEELVRLGYAWWFEKYSTKIALKEIESAARADRRGLWADENPVPPWTWRKDARTR